MILVDSQIIEAVEKGEIIIHDFDKNCVEPATYDMRVGKEGYTSTSKEKVDISEKGTITIGRGDFAIISTYESIELPTTIAARFGVRSYFLRQGLVASVGPQIDPGYRGRLFIQLANLSAKEVTLAYRDEFCSIEFHSLSEPAKKPYNGPYQDQMNLSSEDINVLRAGGGLPFSEVLSTLSTLNKTVGTLTDNVTKLTVDVSSLKWSIPTIVIIGIAIIGVLVAFV